MKNFMQTSSITITESGSHYIALNAPPIKRAPQFFKMRLAFLLLLSVLMYNSVAAQHKGATAYSKKQEITPARNSEQNSELISNNRPEPPAPGDQSNINSLAEGDNIFYIKKTDKNASSRGSSIFTYNTKTKITQDIIKPIATESNYNPESTVENIILDKKMRLLYFTVSTPNRRGILELITWKYDIGAKRLDAYKDGRIESVDADGNQTIVFEAINSAGKFTTRSLVDKDGKLIKVTNAN